MPLIYKTLFEIKLMHEFFLTREDGSIIFEEPGQPDRLAFLRNEFTEGKTSVSNDIQFEFPEPLKSKYEGLFLKLIPTYSGCRIVTRVTPFTLPDQSVVYKPFVDFPTDLGILILASRKNTDIDAYTSSRVRRPCPSVNFFSNDTVLSARTFPFLTNNVPPENSAVEYEQGELSLSASNTIQVFFRQGGTDQWKDVTGPAFANESDRLLLPRRFEYTFTDTTGLTQAEFILRDNNGNEVTRITASNSTGIGAKFFLDFSSKVKPLPITSSFQITDLIHALQVTGDNGYSDNRTIIFNDDLVRSNPWAAIHIGTTATNTAFNLFATDGFLIRRRDALGVWTPAPVFEIPVKSRFAYWRFINDRGRELLVSGALTDYVNKEGRVLVTKEPRSLAKHWFLLRKESPAGTAYVPNPVFTDLILENDRRILYNIRVPQSVLFPVTP